ncbi:hypothetical protein MMX123_02025 [Microbacterium sp. MM2322]|uniref:hypothetical protein n=1 Tax=Microbacterium sp. MM2322 TaxID=3157631 RepID=UPI003D809C82
MPFNIADRCATPLWQEIPLGATVPRLEGGALCGVEHTIDGLNVASSNTLYRVGPDGTFHVEPIDGLDPNQGGVSQTRSMTPAATCGATTAATSTAPTATER